MEFERKDDYGTIEDDIGRAELQRQAEEKKKKKKRTIKGYGSTAILD